LHFACVAAAQTYLIYKTPNNFGTVYKQQPRIAIVKKIRHYSQYEQK